MGGATVMMTVGENLPFNVKCAIEDCGFTSVWDEFKYELKKTYKLSNNANTITNVKIQASYI